MISSISFFHFNRFPMLYYKMICTFSMFYPFWLGKNSYPNWGKDTLYGITHLSHMEPLDITISTVSPR